MRAYRFLGAGATGKLNGFAWPVPSGASPGPWVEIPADGTVTGVFAQRVGDLPYWLAEELWEVELRGDVRAHSTRIAADGARLVRRISGWDESARIAFATACAERTKARALEVLARHELASILSELGDGSSETDERLLRSIEARAPGEAPSLAAGYLADNWACVRAGVFASAAYVAQVVDMDARLGPRGTPTERQHQAEWIRARFTLVDGPMR